MERTILKTISIVFLSSALVSGCSSNPLSSGNQALTKLAQPQTETQGQDGDVSIPLDSVPQPVLDAVMRAEPGGTIIRAESETEKGVVEFELHVQRQNGTVVEVETDGQGNILGTEPYVEDDDAPHRPGMSS